MKFAAAFLASVALATLVPASAFAQAHADTVDPRVPTQLPRTAIPHHYALSVTPNAQQLTFDGKVAIDVEVIKATQTLVLNAADLRIASATLQPAGGGAAQTARITLDAKAQTATLAFPKAITTGSYRLTIAYSGKINTQANGLFALDYKNKEGKDARSLFTQFEAADARRFVPSWDEPDYKATWDLTAIVPANQMAVSNMPAAASKPAGAGLKEVRFQTTPIMSSYLLFFASGDFDRVTKQAGGREVGIVTSRGNGDKAGTALDAEAQILPYYNDYFGTPYPLPKLDNVGGPGQSQFFSAMENWGAIFTFEYAILDDPAITSEGQRKTSSAPKLMRWRTSGLAISSPWRGGTTCGSTRVSPAGWRPRRPNISIRTGAPTWTVSVLAKARCARTPSNRPIRLSNRCGLSNRPTRHSTPSPIPRANRS